MMKQKKTENGGLASSASVVDGKLILAFPEAMTPVVWQMDLDQAKSSALEVQEDKKKKCFSLVLRSINGETTEVAPFEEKAQAVQALMITAQALQEGQGKIRPQTASATIAYPMQAPAASRAHSNKIGGFMAIALIVILMIIWVLSIPRQGENFLKEDGGSNASGASGDVAGDSKAGEPVSADEYLSKP